MKFPDFFLCSKQEIIILGINSLIDHIENAGSLFSDLLTLNDKLKITILYESDSENFTQSLCLDTEISGKRSSFTYLKTHRDRVIGNTRRELKNTSGILYYFNMKLNNSESNDEEKKKIRDRLFFYQMNLRSPFNAILVDDKIWYCFVTNKLPTLVDYNFVEKKTNLYSQIKNYLHFCLYDEEGRVYLSKHGDELIQLFDKDGYPRGILPRASFYTTNFCRHAVWLFIFNRHGELLLHQRSNIDSITDGRGLWDKSAGGHIDLADNSSVETAKRELVEELFLPHAEYSKLIKAFTEDIINFGDWNLKKRDENSFCNSFHCLDAHDWILFRMCTPNNEELTIERQSKRRIIKENGSVVFKKSLFKSDVYFIIAPPGYIDTKEQMKDLLKIAEKRGAAQEHKILSIQELGDWVKKEKERDCEHNVFTNDLLFFATEYSPYLESFSEFIKESINYDKRVSVQHGQL